MCVMKTINVKFINRKEKFIMLVERTNQLIIEVNDVKEYMFTEFGSDIFDSMGEQEFALLKNCLTSWTYHWK